MASTRLVWSTVENDNIFKRVTFDENGPIDITAASFSDGNIDRDIIVAVDNVCDNDKHPIDNNLNNDIDTNITVDNNTNINNCKTNQENHLKNNEEIDRNHIREKKEIKDFTVLRVKDQAHNETISKSIRVHEYYKNWRIYDLDVIY